MRALSLLTALSLLAPSILAQSSETFEFDFVPSNTHDLATFGYSVAASDDWLCSGAPEASADGAVYLHTLGGVVQEVVLNAPDPGTDGQFGIRVALDEPWLAVTESHYGASEGRVHLYHLEGGVWSHAQILDNALADRFGWSLSLDAEAGLLAVGSRDEAVEIFSLEDGSWTSERRLITFGTIGYGWSVAIEGSILAVGAPYNGDQDRGAVFIYQRSGIVWALVDTLVHPALTDDSYFGNSLSMDQQRLLVGAPWASIGALQTGVAFVYALEGGEWIDEGMLTAADPQISDYTGDEVDLRGDVALVRSSLKVDGEGGVVLQFRRQGDHWVRQELRHAAGPSTLVGLAQNSTHAFAGDTFFESNRGRTLGYAITPLSLSVTPKTPALGEDIAIRTHGGAPGNLVALTTATVQGVPHFLVLLRGVSDAQGLWTLLGHHSDPALSGISLELQSFGLDASGKVRASPLEELSFQ